MKDKERNEKLETEIANNIKKNKIMNNFKAFR